MSIAKPFTFVANTYAKASEVNANFDTVYSQVNSNISAISQNAVDIENLENNKADINGNTAQRFAVADAITDSDAINKRMLRASIANSVDYISGFMITKDSGNPNNTIIVSEGSCYDSTKAVVLNKNNSSTKTNDNQAANATYYVYVIGNATGSSVDILISTESVTPSLPSGYSLYRQIGYYTTNSDNKIFSIDSNSNTKDTSTTFVYSQLGIGNGTTSLSTYLPNDGKVYLVLVEAACEGYGSQAKIKTDICPSDVYMCRGDYDSGRATQAAGACFFPIGSGRSITASGTQWATIKGYMRV